MFARFLYVQLAGRDVIQVIILEVTKRKFAFSSLSKEDRGVAKGPCVGLAKVLCALRRSCEFVVASGSLTQLCMFQGPARGMAHGTSVAACLCPAIAANVHCCSTLLLCERWQARAIMDCQCKEQDQHAPLSVSGPCCGGGDKGCCDPRAWLRCLQYCQCQAPF